MDGSGRGSTGNVIAALCSLFVPGLGQLLQGRLLAAAFFFVVVGGLYALYFLVIPYLIALPLHLWAILNAALYRPRT